MTRSETLKILRAIHRLEDCTESNSRCSVFEANVIGETLDLKTVNLVKDSYRLWSSSWVLPLLKSSVSKSQKKWNIPKDEIENY